MKKQPKPQQVIKNLDNGKYYAGSHHLVPTWAEWENNSSAVFAWVYNLPGSFGTVAPSNDLTTLISQGFNVCIADAPEQSI